MPRAEEFQAITRRLFFWQAYDPSVKTDLSCCAVIAPEGLVFVDPIALADDALDELAALAPPVAIVLTNGNHARAAVLFRTRFSVPIFTHAEAAPELGLAVDRFLAEGDIVAGGLAVIELPGAGAGEIGLFSPADASLHLGDALIHVEPRGLTLLPEKYCRAPRTLTASLQKLLPLPCDILTFAHGTPLVADACQSVARLLA